MKTQEKEGYPVKEDSLEMNQYFQNSSKWNVLLIYSHVLPKLFKQKNIWCKIFYWHKYLMEFFLQVGNNKEKRINSKKYNYMRSKFQTVGFILHLILAASGIYEKTPKWFR